MMNIAQLLIENLIANGYKSFYCLPGVQNDDLFNALYDRSDVLKPIQTRHEQGAAYMAMGAALASGKPQACCLVPGPGMLNGAAALCTAYAVNAPVLALIGQIPSHTIDRGLGMLHEIPQQHSILSSLTKSASSISCAARAGEQIRTALQAMRSGRPRPVGLEIPVDKWRENTTTTISPVDAAPAPAVDTDAIARAAQLLKQAQSPMIVLGSGAQAHSASIRTLAENLSAATVAFRNGHGVMASDHELCMSMPSAHSIWPAVDVVIGLGTRLQAQQMSWGLDENLKTIHIDIDATELGRIQQPSVAIHADLHDVLPLLLAELQGHENQRPRWRQKITAAKQQYDAIYAKKLTPQIEWLAAIRTELPPEGIFVDELTQVGYVSRFAFPTYQPRTFISTGYQGTLGYGFATALGAAHSNPNVPVVAISGDGGALFTISELATAVQHKIPVTCVVFNDNAFGNVRRLQIDNYQGRTIASDLQSPDFVKLAKAYGAIGMRAHTPEQLKLCLRQAIAQQAGPTIIEVPVGEMPSPWEFVLLPTVRG